MPQEIIERYNTIIVSNNITNVITTYEKIEDGYWTITYTLFGQHNFCPYMAIACRKAKCVDWKDGCVGKPDVLTANEVLKFLASEPNNVDIKFE